MMPSIHVLLLTVSSIRCSYLYYDPQYPQYTQTKNPVGLQPFFPMPTGTTGSHNSYTRNESYVGNPTQVVVPQYHSNDYPSIGNYSTGNFIPTIASNNSIMAAPNYSAPIFSSRNVSQCNVNLPEQVVSGNIRPDFAGFFNPEVSKTVSTSSSLLNSPIYLSEDLYSPSGGSQFELQQGQVAPSIKFSNFSNFTGLNVGKHQSEVRVVNNTEVNNYPYTSSQQYEGNDLLGRAVQLIQFAINRNGFLRSNLLSSSRFKSSFQAELEILKVLPCKKQSWGTIFKHVCIMWNIFGELSIKNSNPEYSKPSYIAFCGLNVLLDLLQHKWNHQKYFNTKKRIIKNPQFARYVSDIFSSLLGRMIVLDVDQTFATLLILFSRIRLEFSEEFLSEMVSKYQSIRPGTSSTKRKANNRDTEYIAFYPPFDFSQSFMTLFGEALDFSQNSTEFLSHPRSENEQLIADTWKQVEVKSSVVQRICLDKSIFSDILHKTGTNEFSFKVLQRIIKKEGFDIDDYDGIRKPANAFNFLFSWILRKNVSFPVNQSYLLLSHLLLSYHNFSTINESHSATIINSYKELTQMQIPNVFILQSEAHVPPPASESDFDWGDEFLIQDVGENFPATATQLVPESKKVLPAQIETVEDDFIENLLAEEKLIASFNDFPDFPADFVSHLQTNDASAEQLPSQATVVTASPTFPSITSQAQVEFSLQSSLTTEAFSQHSRPSFEEDETSIDTASKALQVNFNQKKRTRQAYAGNVPKKRNSSIPEFYTLKKTRL